MGNQETSTFIPQPYPDYPGFYYIPTIDGYIVNDRGVMIRLKTGKRLKAYKSKKGYPLCSVKINKRSNSYRVHKFVCLAFHGLPPKDKPFVNHIDGDKENNHYKNLEWCSTAENLQHAIDTGLRGKPVYVWDIIDDPDQQNITRYHSPTKAGEAIPNGLPICMGAVANRPAGKNIYKGRYVLKYVDDPTPWPDLNLLLAKKYKKQIKRSVSRKPYMRKVYPIVLLYNTQTNLLSIYDNARVLASENNFPIYSVNESLRLKRYKYKHFLIFYKNDHSSPLLDLLNSFSISLNW